MNAPLNLTAYGWAQLDDGDWQFRDPSIPELAYLQSLQEWTRTCPPWTPPPPKAPRVVGLPDFVLGSDGQVTAERGLHYLQPQQPFIVSEGGLTVSSLYGAAQSPRAHDFEFHRSNPHLRAVHPAAPLPAGTRVHVPARWIANLRGAGYAVHHPTAVTGLGGNMAVTADTLAKANAAAAAAIAAQVAAQTAYLEAVAGAASAPPLQLREGTGMGDAAVANVFGDTASSIYDTLAYVLPLPVYVGPQASPATPPDPTSGPPGMTQTAFSSSAPPPPPPPPAALPSARSGAAPIRPSPAPDPSHTVPAPAPSAPPPASPPASSSSTPWIIGGVVAGAALLGVSVAVMKKRAAKGS